MMDQPITAGEKLIAMVRTIATAAPTYLVTAALIVQILIDEIGEDWQWGTALLLKVLAALGFAIRIIRRVTPVMRHERGVLLQ